MKIVHLSDTHLGYREFHKIDQNTGINQREQDVYDAFKQAVERILEIGPDVVIHAGDLFDTVRPTNRAVNVAFSQFGRLCENDIPTVIIAGNHDTPKIATTGTIMQSLDNFPLVDAVTSDAEQPGGGYRSLRIGEMAVHAVSDASTQQQLQDRLNQLSPDSDARWNIAVLHAGVRQIQDQVYSGEFNEHYISKSLLDNLQMDYVALGHYHKRMKLDIGCCGWYSGGLERFSFNEAAYRPGFLEIELDEDIQVKPVHLKTRRFIRLEEIDASGKSADDLCREIDEELPPEDELEDTMIAISIISIEETVRSLLEEKLFEPLRETVFESRIRLYGPEGEMTGERSLKFKDLHQEFADYLENIDPDQESDPESLLETGQHYLSVALGEEDEV